MERARRRHQCQHQFSAPCIYLPLALSTTFDNISFLYTNQDLSDEEDSGVEIVDGFIVADNTTEDISAEELFRADLAAAAEKDAQEVAGRAKKAKEVAAKHAAAAAQRARNLKLKKEAEARAAKARALDDAAIARAFVDEDSAEDSDELMNDAEEGAKEPSVKTKGDLFSLMRSVAGSNAFKLDPFLCQSLNENHSAIRNDMINKIMSMDRTAKRGDALTAAKITPCMYLSWFFRP